MTQPGLGWPSPTSVADAISLREQQVGWPQPAVVRDRLPERPDGAGAKDVRPEDVEPELVEPRDAAGLPDPDPDAACVAPEPAGRPSQVVPEPVETWENGRRPGLLAPSTGLPGAKGTEASQDPLDEASRRIRSLVRTGTGQSGRTGEPAPRTTTDAAELPAYDARIGRPGDDDETPIGAAAAAALVRWDPASDPFPRPAALRVITVANQKGGVGKTTSTVNLAVALALHGARVLVVDLDPQGNASTGLGVSHEAGTPDIYDVLINGLEIQDVVQPAPGIDGCWCVPATIDLAGAEIELVSVVARETRLRRAIEAYLQLPDVELDYVFIDCPPSLGLLTLNAMVATREVLIPIQCEYYALEGLGQLLKTVDLVKVHLNSELEVSTILLTMYDARTRLADQVAHEVRTHFGGTVLGAAIPRSVRVSEAPGYGLSVVTYDPGSRGAQAYVAAARELAHKGAAAPQGSSTTDQQEAT